jgi:hypothetical protein
MPETVKMAMKGFDQMEGFPACSKPGRFFPQQKNFLCIRSFFQTKEKDSQINPAE